MSEREVRNMPVEFRIEEAADGSVILEGHAAVFNKNSEPIAGLFLERIAPGAFANVLGNDVRMLFNHDPNFVLGRTKAGTLELSEDAKGLKIRSTLPATQVAADLVTSIKRGDISQMSFAFTTGKEEWDYKEKTYDVRTVVEVDQLFDVSPVTYPAYHQTDIAVAKRSHETNQPGAPVVRQDRHNRCRLPRQTG